uniref:Uncharacterized protein n=1 Tax=Molossus molossus TaxID=27622 RepID=A0A7J8F995_MOLMO|nr:hypothetical protein HJG59_008506 [Molossus molossus]
MGKSSLLVLLAMGRPCGEAESAEWQYRLRKGPPCAPWVQLTRAWWLSASLSVGYKGQRGCLLVRQVPIDYWNLVFHLYLGVVKRLILCCLIRVWLCWKYFKNSQGPSHCGLVVELRPMHQKVASSIPSQGTCPGCVPDPQWGACRRRPINVLSHRCFYLSLPLPSPLSKGQ